MDELPKERRFAETINAYFLRRLGRRRIDDLIASLEAPHG
jgi:hypothetical protein